ncbi:MAG: phosphoribosyltransferase [Gammaproteobacteria bacterium]
MNYRSVADLNRIIVSNLYRIPDDVDLIVGVPRSGMLAASLVALHSNRSLTNLQGYIEGKILRPGMQRAGIGREANDLSNVRRALVIDDSVLSGAEMERTRGEVEAAGLMDSTDFATVFCLPGMEDTVDLAFELCATPRVFEWNLLHGHMLPQCCVDIDGVLCVDPTEEQNDDGPRYRDFLRTATPLWRPSSTISMLVTSRLEKYRDLTEEWLAANGVEYDQLIMMQYNTMEERKAAKAYGSFKADVYAKSDNIFFIESNDWTASEIARLSGKPALCTETQTVYDPYGLPYLKQNVKGVVQESQSLTKRIIRKFGRSIRAVCQPGPDQGLSQTSARDGLPNKTGAEAGEPSSIVSQRPG